MALYKLTNLISTDPSTNFLVEAYALENFYWALQISGNIDGKITCIHLNAQKLVDAMYFEIW